MAHQIFDNTSSPKQPVSKRKAEANRRNSLNSTGPRTLRGKDHSRRNSLKHGFFSTDLSKDFVFLGENAQQFNELLYQLQQGYKPVGIAEELEVGRIAQCWWKLKRASRYENAEIYFGQVQVISQAPPPPPTVREMMMPREKSLTLLLEGAEKEIEASGEISSELQEKLAADPSFRDRWTQLQATVKPKHDEVVGELAQETGMSPAVLKKWISKSPEVQAKYASAVALATTKLAKKCIEYQAEHRFESIMSLVVDRQAIPDREALDKLLRYEAAIERDLSRALDRLERLQRRRKGEPVPPPVSVRLTR